MRRAAFFIVVAAVGVTAFSTMAADKEGFASVELKFTDASPNGILIVPASCPSSPHYAGECSVNPGIPAPPPDNGCVLGISPSTIVSGGSATLSWNSTYYLLGVPLPMTGTISPSIGPVAGSGSTSISPTQTTTFTGTFTPTGAQLGQIRQSWLTPVSCSATVTVLASAPGAQRCSAQYYCSGANLMYQNANCSDTFIARCDFGCSSSACLGTPESAANISAVPQLVRYDDSTVVSWNASNVTLCTVTGSNGDSWSGKTGSETSGQIKGQTIYTLTCTRTTGGDIVKTATVNLIPVFQER